MNKGAVAAILGLMMAGGVAAEPVLAEPILAEPKVLADWELDAITAAGVLLDVSSIAAALGDFAHADTNSNTIAFGGKHLKLGVGITIGQALACCGENADVEVDSAVLGIGDIVHGTTHRVKHEGSRLAYGLSVGFVVALSLDEHFPEEHFATARDEHLALLRELRAALADFQFELPDAVTVGAQ